MMNNEKPIEVKGDIAVSLAHYEREWARVARASGMMDGATASESANARVREIGADLESGRTAEVLETLSIVAKDYEGGSYPAFKVACSDLIDKIMKAAAEPATQVTTAGNPQIEAAQQARVQAWQDLADAETALATAYLDAIEGAKRNAAKVEHPAGKVKIRVKGSAWDNSSWMDRFSSVIAGLSDTPLTNPEYVRGQLELAVSFIDTVDDGTDEKIALARRAFPSLTDEEILTLI